MTTDNLILQKKYQKLTESLPI